MMEKKVDYLKLETWMAFAKAFSMDQAMALSMALSSVTRMAHVKVYSMDQTMAYSCFSYTGEEWKLRYTPGLGGGVYAWNKDCRIIITTTAAHSLVL